MDFTGVLIGLVLMAIAVFFAVTSTKEVIEQRKEKKKLQEELAKKDKNIETIVSQSSKISKVEEEKNKTKDKIKEVESDEEVAAIVNDVVDAHNDRVRKQRESRKDSNISKTSKGTSRNKKSK